LVDTGCSQVHPNFQLENSSQQFYHSNLALVMENKTIGQSFSKNGLTLDICFRVFYVALSFLAFFFVSKTWSYI
jgi:hypothetical protein